ncbi:hypothetical protein GGD63_001908 [Bradyrhizobium sp. cir1]|uniref:hypothetical protein n=1 Tax=Bradyrhizobium sp. cir1 TaxID=1445730 RepID=UPI001606AF92|nr:hypothetical protein [Bradyrhizobium sp. cir1]MBB4369120.1 hypothetical protein [Bradyrhizobium sp. cir1]
MARSQNSGFPAAAPGSPLHAGIVPGFTSTVLFSNFGDPIDTLPEPAAERLHRLRQEREEAAILGRATFEQWQSLHEEAQRRRSRIAQLRAPRGVGIGLTEPGFNLDDDDPRVTVERAALTKQEAELARLKKLQDQHGARLRILSTLVSQVENWIKATPSGTTIGMHPIDVQLKKGENPADAVARLQHRSRELEADRQRIITAPWPSHLAKERMRQQIAVMAESGRPRADQLVDFGEPVRFATRSIPARVLNVAPEAIAFFEIPDALGLLAWLHQDELIRRLDAEIDATADDANALDADQRRQAEAEILADRLIIEREEAELCWRQAADGGPILHRPDLDPQALLGVKLIAASSADAG